MNKDLRKQIDYLNSRGENSWRAQAYQVTRKLQIQSGIDMQDIWRISLTTSSFLAACYKEFDEGEKKQNLYTKPSYEGVNSL